MCRSTNSFILVCLSSLCRCTSSTLKRKYKFNVSALSFLNSIELLLFAYVTVSMNDPPGDEWVSLAVTLDCFEFVETHLFPLAHEYLAVIRGLLTFDASLNGAGRFAVSAADLACREEWARVSTVDSSLSGTQIISTVLLSHASAFPTRAALAELNKKAIPVPPVGAVSKASSKSAASDQDGNDRKRKRTDESSGSHDNEYKSWKSYDRSSEVCKLFSAGKCKWGKNCNRKHEVDLVSGF